MPFFLSFFLALSDRKRTNRKKWVNKDKDRKKWNDADVSVAFSAQKSPILCGFIEVCQCISKG